MAKELEEFFKGLPAEDKSKADIFNDKKATGEVAKSSEGESEEDTPKKNRHHRRLEQKLQEEREASIQMAATIKAQKDLIDSLNESGKFRKEVNADVNDTGLKGWLKIYGDTPEHREAYEVLKNNIISPISQKAEKLEKELEEIKNRDSVEKQQVKEFEGFLDKQFENIEDTYDVDITSDSKEAEKTRNEFIDLIKQLSPKDEEGNITSYADFNGVWEIYQSRQTKEDNSVSEKRNEIASRSMANSGGGATAKPAKPTPGFYGWKKDLRL
jgi:hypothetical protein